MSPKPENTLVDKVCSSQTQTKSPSNNDDIGFRIKSETRKWDTGPTRPSVVGQQNGKTKGISSTTSSSSEVTYPWRVWPWRVIGDRVSLYLGWLILALPGPFMAVLIGTGEISMAVLKFFWLHLVPERVRIGIRGGIKEWSERLAEKCMVDPRNAPFLPHMIWLSIWIPALFALTAYRHFSVGHFEWSLFFIYHFLRIGPRFRFFAHLHVLVHREGHYSRGLFKGAYKVFNFWPSQWWVGQFFGQVPNSYGIAHNKIHHRYDNGLDDVHTNLDLDRTKFLSFVIYVPRFLAYWSGVSPLIHFLLHKEYKFARKMAAGMLYYYSIMALLFFFDWKFALAYFVFPFFEATIFFAGISYMWHCWVDPKDPYNPYVSSVTIINGHDNIWNEDYHVVHHDALSVHWSLAPAHFEAHKDRYAKYNATVFEDCEEGLMLYWMLSGNWDELANHFVDLNGKMTFEQKKALLLERAAYTVKPA
eukprot:CAMPEP_0201556106 /NCGR_PEP_ID=MMETSP0173_2-20130828/53160_1 /ASSEMBLY_ACC=CAM_ASM_000268 /TAXON_ID=218659 /ORGANISM="Vexillifera sp., Strain DIVA3 564/2" /LENGTH=473 /DNA_ID=CAMNT_0047968191 /DNA_START=242 /DNA_END=1659 /DNA_ORIENTATION=+